MTLIIGMVFGSIMALFFTVFGMALQRKIDRTEDDDAK